MNVKKYTLAYYDLVDSGSFDKMFDLFADGICYVRAGERILGIDNFKTFYKEKRKIRGSHTIEEVHVGDGEVIVKGVFSGRNASHEDIEIQFVDLFYFNERGKISLRETYINSGFHLTT